MLADFHFLRPAWLVLFVPLLAFLYWFARRTFERRRWERVIDPQLMPHMLIGADRADRRMAAVWLALAGTLLILALAGPAWQRLPQPVFRNQDALVIALDLSRSMDVADLQPSRLARARFKISDILKQRDEGQSALIVYAADAFVVSPLTDDTHTIAAQLPALETAMMPAQGSHADRALNKAADLFKQAGVAHGRVLLVTDGVRNDAPADAAAQLRRAGYRVSVLGVGTPRGGPIPGPRGFIKGNDGDIVIAALDDTKLSQVAARGGGRYRRLTLDNSDIEALMADAPLAPNDVAATDRQADVWREAGPWLLLPLLPLAAFAFRRGIVALWLLAFLLPLLSPMRSAAAADWSDLWSRPDQRAERMLDEGDAATAAATFDDPAWKAAAEYRAARYEKSLAALEGLDGVDATYNRGNALAQLGRYDEAIAEYNSVLERDPDNADARYNRDQVMRAKQRQQQSDQSGQSGQSDRDTQQPGQGQDGDGQQQSAQNGSGGAANSAGSQGSGAQSSAGSTDNSDGSTPDERAGGDNAGEQAQANAAGSSDAQQGGENPDADGASSQPQAMPETRVGAPQSGAAPADNGMRANANDAAEAGVSDEADHANAMGDTRPEGEPDASGAPGERHNVAAASRADANAAPDEETQKMEQWLRRIPDDPGGLLRRKFYYQYQQRGREQEEDQPW